MKICTVTTWPPHHDGIALYSVNLYRCMSSLVDVKIIANTSNSYGASYASGCKVFRCWRRRSPIYPFKIFRRILTENPEIVHLQHGWLLYGDVISSLLFPFLLLLLRLANKPRVVTMHTVIGSNVHLYRNRIANFIAKLTIVFLTRIIVKLSDRIIVHNGLMKKTLEDVYSLQKDGWKIVVVPHGVRETPRKPKNIRRDGRNCILLHGFIRRNMGIECLIEAFRIFLGTHPNAVLVIAGGQHAHDKKDYVKEIKQKFSADFPKNIVFTGFIDEETLDRLIWESSLIVLSSMESSYIEASGSLARVAMYGKPIVCSRVPKFEAELEDGRDCIMIKPCDPTSLAEALALLSDNAYFRRRIGSNLKRKFRDRCWSNVAEQHVKLFKSINFKSI